MDLKLHFGEVWMWMLMLLKRSYGELSEMFRAKEVGSLGIVVFKGAKYEASHRIPLCSTYDV